MALIKHKISPRGVAFISSFEGFVPYVYDDKKAPVLVGGKRMYAEWDGGPVRGTLTIGFGHTDAAKHPLKIKQGLRINRTQAQEILDVDLDECEADVNRLVTEPIDQSEFDALVSFCFNCGSGNLKKLIAPLNRGDRARCRANFDQYVRSKGEFMRGLQRRRDAEQVLWDADDELVAAVIPKGEEIIEHPAEVDKRPSVVVEAVKSRTVWSLITAKTALWVGVLTEGARNAVQYVFPGADLSAAPHGILEAAKNVDVQGIVSDTQMNLDTWSQMGTWFGLHTQTISLYVVVAAMLYAIWRRAKDKQEQSI
jgi:lysozyme